VKYLWADTHFGHNKILEFASSTRKFSSVEEMNESMISKWNETVRQCDEIYFLGDFSFEKDPTATYLRLHGKKHLIVGNHDENRKGVLELGWASVSHLLTIKENNHRAVCCHYPIESWSQMHYGSLMLHGHSHGNLIRKVPKRFDVGVDVFERPIDFEELITMASTENFVAQDNHAPRK
jgi:calcineurin-like phosphoesterase family protein